MRMQFWLHSNQWVEICIYLKFSFEKIDLNQFLYENDCSFHWHFGPFFLPFSDVPSLSIFFYLCIFNQRRDEKEKRSFGIKERERERATQFGKWRGIRGRMWWQFVLFFNFLFTQKEERGRKKIYSLSTLIRYLVDPASSDMLVSKIKPCTCQYKLLYGETANGSLNQL